MELAAEFKLVVTAVRGALGEGYVGVDDFEFEADADTCGTIPVAAAPPTTTPVSSTLPTNTFPECSFAETTCGWVEDDSHTWRRTQVSDLNAEGYDGPKEDHDGNNED